uniref:Uncharacterized protein n=1 Tax=Pectinophora gossypiella TaxID=13191 RepID=A0A1E1W903_PECGO
MSSKTKIKRRKTEIGRLTHPARRARLRRLRLLREAEELNSGLVYLRECESKYRYYSPPKIFRENISAVKTEVTEINSEMTEKSQLDIKTEVIKDEFEEFHSEDSQIDISEDSQIDKMEVTETAKVEIKTEDIDDRLHMLDHSSY